MRRSLRPHQLDAFRYCRQQQHPALFMEMRLGKTLVVIRRLQLLSPERVLIVAPHSALGSWEKELAAESEPAPAWLTGKRSDRRKALKSGARWNLLNKEGWRWIPEVALEQWDAVVLDESTFVKNPQARVTKFYLKNFRSARRFALTGTPDPEGVKDLFCQMAWLDGGAFGFRDYWGWRSVKFEPSMLGDGWEPKPGTESEVRRALAKRAFLLRRQDAGLGERWVMETRWLDLPPKLRKAYDTLEREFIVEWDGSVKKETVFAGARYAWARQMCGGFLDGEQVWKGREDDLVELLTGELAQDPVVVWFTFNRELDAVAARLQTAHVSHAWMKGATKQTDRRRIFDAFQSGEIRVLLLQVAVAQFGVDLSRADAEVYFSAPCGYLLRRQSRDRIVNVAQKRPLLCIDYAVRNTVDQDLHAATHDKRVRSERTFREVLRLQMKGRLELSNV